MSREETTRQFWAIMGIVAVASVLLIAVWHFCKVYQQRTRDKPGVEQIKERE